MATPSQIAANRANAQKSTGPTTEEGKAVSSLNNFRLGFTGEFRVLDSEDQDQFELLKLKLFHDHQPRTAVEKILVDKLAKHTWLSDRAMNLQQSTMCNHDMDIDDRLKLFALYLRYQTTNDRAFHKCLDQLLKLRAEKRKEQIGFESQERKRNQQSRSQAEELRGEDDEKHRKEERQKHLSRIDAEIERCELMNSAPDSAEKAA